MALPRLAEGGYNRQLPQALRGLRRVQSVEEVEAILAYGLGIGVAFGLPLRQPRIFDPLAIALIPYQGGQALEPVGCHRGQGVEGSAERLGHEFEAIHHPDSRKHMRRVGALLAPRCQQAKRLAPLEQLVQQQLSGTAGQQAVPKFTQH